MAESILVSGINKKERDESLIPQIEFLVEGESDYIANLSNILSALKYGLNFFWAGVYFVKKIHIKRSADFQNQTDEALFLEISPDTKNSSLELVLGPFQGPVACSRIAYGKGVCGKCWELKKTIIVEDVNQFPGHISCNSISKSEIVLPVFNERGDVVLILDIDSEKISNFDAIDKMYLEKVAAIIRRCAEKNAN